MRAEQSGLRARANGGELSITDLLHSGAPFAKWPLWRVVGLLRGYGTGRVAILNELALIDGVNLAVTLGAAPAPTLRWVERRVREGSTEAGSMRQWRYRVLHVRWRDIGERLLAAIATHRQAIDGDDTATKVWANADRELWDVAAAVNGEDGA